MLLLGFFMMMALDFKDAHTFGNTREVVNTHLSLDLTLDFEKNVMDGVCELGLAYPDPNKTPAHLDLDSRDLTILKVTDGAGNELKYELIAGPSYMGSDLRIALPSALNKVRISYRTAPGAAALQWLTPAQTTSKKLPFLFTQSQAILARTWIPCMDSPGIRVTYDAVVRVPKGRGFTAVMSANHGKHEPGEGIFRFEMPHAIPPYLIALAAGEIAFKAVSDRTGVYAEPAVVEKAAWEFADMDKMVKTAESIYGKYRWGRWDAIVLPPSFPFGGMENPTLTFATPTLLAGDRSLVSVMAHELAHSWSGNLVTNATWSDFWLNEGFTTYFERRIMEALYGKDIADMHWLLGQHDVRETMKDWEDKKEAGFNKLFVDVTNRDPDDAFSDVPYEKGANFLHVLETHFGRTKFDTFLRGYFDKFAFQPMTTQAFLDYASTNLFENDLAAWKNLKIDEWVYQGGLPDNMIVVKSDRFERTGAAAKAFAAGGNLDAVKKDWITAEWLDFLNGLPREMERARLDQLDGQFHFSRSGNSEILFAWLAVCIPSNYEVAYPALESFLTRMGRRKFLKPLYEAMEKNPNTRDLARAIYQKARPGYHPISTNTIDAILNYQP